VRSRFYAWTELSHQLTKLKSSQFAGATQWLADLYDNFQPPSASEYRDVAKNIRFPFAPRTNILGFSSEDWFFDNLSEVDSAGGFFPRWLLFDARGDRTIAMSKDRDPRVLKSLSKALARLLAIPEGEQVQFPEGFVEPGEMPTSRCPYNVWYNTTKRRFVATHPKLGGIFWARHRVNILKLAAIYQASMDGTVQVTMEAWERAVVKADKLEETVFRFLNTNMTKFGYKYQQAIALIRERTADGFPCGQFTNKVCQDPVLRKQILETFRETGDVVAVQRDHPGRKGPVPMYLSSIIRRGPLRSSNLGHLRC
jgi:hypothetical protein